MYDSGEFTEMFSSVVWKTDREFCVFRSKDPKRHQQLRRPLGKTLILHNGTYIQFYTLRISYKKNPTKIMYRMRTGHRDLNEKEK